MRKRTMSKAAIPVAVFAASALLLGGCSTSSSSSSDDAASAPAANAQPRVAVTYEGGVAVLDGTTLEVVDEFSTEEFTRVNPAGDGRHVFVTMSEGFQLLDTGTWTDESGAAQTADPELTDLIFEADTAGHVVRHGGKTVLYADGTSDTTIIETADLLTLDGDLPETEVVEAPDAHHGVSIVLDDGTLLTTIGDSEGRSGVRVLDADREEIASNEECPGVHGEGTAMNEAVVFGCEDGALVYSDGEITKLTAPDSYGRMGNAFVTDTSPIVLGDYKSDPDLEGYLLSAVALIDTEAMTLQVVELPEGVEYTFRDLGRTPDDDALILSADGSLYVMDVETGEITDEFPVVEAWEGPVEWQDAHPALTVNGSVAYVTEPATDSVHAVDLETGEITSTGELDGAPVEIAVAAG
ncbi:zinc metallochaperone AztD [Marisediminicola sp. LYQ134]|uniref:zinc metallochaperone AztD n=1 Tax=Marisediminicola sp. LYQ134 TaxID=3391061 RepID=UPI003983A57A